MNIVTNSAEETITYAKGICDYFKPGSVYGFRGELASGKTTFIKGVLKGLGYSKMVNSPTFTLINEYDAKHKVIHIDCYREKNINRWLNIGLIDYLSEDNILFIEWAKNIQSILPNEINNIYFNVLDTNKRLIKCNE